MSSAPFEDLRLKPGEWPKQERLQELLDGITQNFEDLYRKFPITSENTSGVLRGINGASRIAGGRVELEWNGAGETSNTAEVKHGLGILPGAVTLTLDTLITVAGSANLFGVGIERTSKTIFKCNATLPTGSKPVAGTKVRFNWIALA